LANDSSTEHGEHDTVRGGEAEHVEVDVGDTRFHLNCDHTADEAAICVGDLGYTVNCVACVTFNRLSTTISLQRFLLGNSFYRRTSENQVTAKSRKSSYFFSNKIIQTKFEFNFFSQTNNVLL
jgi:hypothetical protein